MIKRFICVLVSFICLFSVNIFALQLDSDFYVYGQNNKQLCEVIGMRESELENYCKTNSITFLAVNKTNTKQIRKTEVKDDFSKKVGNFLALKDKEIIDLAADITGFSDVSGTVLEKGNKKFLKVELKTEDSGGEYILTQYITVTGGTKEVLTFYTAANEDTDYIEDVFSSQFKTSSALSGLKIVAVVGIVLFSVLAVLVLVAIIRDTFEKEPTE